MIRSNRRSIAVLGGALALLTIAVAIALIARERQADERAVRAASQLKQHRAREFTRAYRESQHVAAAPKSQQRRCELTGTKTIARLPNARVYETNFRPGEVDSEDPTTNRVYACHYETGRRTDLGINDTTSGNSFGLAKGAGDLLAYTTTMWLPADGSADCFFALNLRTQKPVLGDPSCNNVQSSETVDDIVLTANGSFAYSTVADQSLKVQIIAKPHGEPKVEVVDEFTFDGVNEILLLHQDGMLKWLDAERDLRAVRLQ